MGCLNHWARIVTWNPVKELKAVDRKHFPGRALINVESGEGIERSACHSAGICVHAVMESGEGIESLFVNTLNASPPDTVESGEGIESA